MKFVISNQVVLSRVPEGPIAPYLVGFADSTGCERVDIRCFQRRMPEAGEVISAKLVAHHEENVSSRVGSKGVSSRGEWPCVEC